jgi:hypothetical protein
MGMDFVIGMTDDEECYTSVFMIFIILLVLNNSPFPICSIATPNDNPLYVGLKSSHLNTAVRHQTILPLTYSYDLCTSNPGHA